MAKKGLPKSIVKKYGISKKAWAIYRSKTHADSRRTGSLKKRRAVRNARLGIMARKRRVRKRIGRFSLKSELVPIAVATFTEPLVDSLADRFAGQLNIGLGGVQMDDLIKVGIGLYAGKKSGLTGKVAKYYGVFGMRNIVKGLLSGSLQQPLSASSSAPMPSF